MAKMKNREEVFFKLLSSENAKLLLDNDMCYITYGKPDEDGDQEGESFNYGPKELAFMLCSKLGIDAESV